MITALIITLWIIGGTATFRRAGHAVIERAKVKNEYRDEMRAKIGSHHGVYCNRGSRYGKVLSRDGCDCGLAKRVYDYMPFVILSCVGAWPLLVLGWGAANGMKTYANLRGENYSFFVPAKMVKSKDERILDLEASIIKLEAENHMREIDR